MRNINLRYFDGSVGLERESSFKVQINPERDISHDKLFAQNISAEIMPVMDTHSSISERICEISKQFNELHKTRASKLRMS